MAGIIYSLIEYFKNNLHARIILFIILGLFLMVFVVRVLSRFLRDLDYLQESLLRHIIKFGLFLWKLVKLIFSIIFFPYILIKALIRNHKLKYLMVNNSIRKDVIEWLDSFGF